MRRRVLALFAVLQFALTGTALAQEQSASDPAAAARGAAAGCPKLPAGSGLSWEYSQGPDFGVCYAHVAGSDENAFGIYFGYAPSFHPDQAKRIGDGRVAGKRVTWYRASNEDKPLPFARETLLKRDSGSVSHVWVQASSQQQLDQRLAILDQMRFQR